MVRLQLCVALGKLHEPTCASATAMSTSVTVSMGELTTGVPRRMFLVSCVARST